MYIRMLFFSFLFLASGHLYSQTGNDGWESLFDGKTLNGWKRLAGSADYKAANQVIVGTTVVNSGNSFLATDKEYKDFILEMDVKIMDTAGNAGIQVRSHYDPSAHQGRGLVYGYQFEIDPSGRRWSGGIYDEGRRGWLYPVVLHPEAHEAFKPGVYNHIRMECIGNEIKTWINNIPVAFLVDSADRKGFIALQVHAISNAQFAGEKVYWKNLKIKTLDLYSTPFPKGIFVVNKIPNYLTEYEKNNGWRLLFNGYDATGWKGAYKPGFPEKGWRVKDGVITVLSNDGKEGPDGGDIVTTEQFSAFDLSFECKLNPGANSGVKYFVITDNSTKGSAIGLEYQVLDDSLHPDAKLGRNGNRTLASLYDLIPAEKQPRFVHPIGEWNTGRIIVYPDNHVEHYLNGVKVLEYKRGSAAFRKLVAISKFKDWPRFGEAEEGPILLQDHGNEVSFRSIKIKKLNNN